jgi:hypothetical protein
MAGDAASTRNEADSQAAETSEVTSGPASGPRHGHIGRSAFPDRRARPVAGATARARTGSRPGNAAHTARTVRRRSAAHRAALSRRALWLIGCLLLALLAAGQLVYHFRGPTSPGRSRHSSHARKRLRTAGLHHTGAAPVRSGKHRSIGTDAGSRSRTSAAAVRIAAQQRRTFAQDWPHLELTLTDTADRAVVRACFRLPTICRQARRRPHSMPHRNSSISLLIDPADSGASGYRLYVFYP